MSPEERDIVIEALDQYISNSEEVCEPVPGLDAKLKIARDLLERLQIAKLIDDGVPPSVPR